MRDESRPALLPGILNSDFEAIFGVSMGTIRKRAAQINELLAL